MLTPAPNMPTVDQVLNKYMTAIGGAQNVARMTSFIATGKSVGYRGFGGGGVVEVAAQAPDKRGDAHQLSGVSRPRRQRAHLRRPHRLDRDAARRGAEVRAGRERARRRAGWTRCSHSPRRSGRR